MSQKHIILGVSICIILAGVGIIFSSAFQPDTQKNTATTAPTTQLPPSIKQVDDAQAPATNGTQPLSDVDLSQAFEDALNSLLIDIKQRTATYNAQRTALARAMSPANITAAKNLSDHLMTVQRLSAEQRTTIDDILLSFESTNATIENLLFEHVHNEDKRTALLKNWKEMKTQQVNAYFSFFEIEEQIITAQLNLMQLYAEQDSVQYNNTDDTLTLSNPQAQDKADTLKDVIDDFKNDQASAFAQ